MKRENLFKVEVIFKEEFKDQKACKKAAFEAHEISNAVLKMIQLYNQRNGVAHINFYGAAGDPAPTNLGDENLHN